MKRVCKKCGYVKREGKFYVECISDNDECYPEWYFKYYDICKECVKEIKKEDWDMDKEQVLKDYYRYRTDLEGN